jgi:hypothetical protein
MLIMSKRYPVEQRERAVKMVLDHLDEYRSVYAACQAIGPKAGVGAESLRRLVLGLGLSAGIFHQQRHMPRIGLETPRTRSTHRTRAPHRATSVVTVKLSMQCELPQAISRSPFDVVAQISVHCCVDSRKANSTSKVRPPVAGGSMHSVAVVTLLGTATVRQGNRQLEHVDAIDTAVVVGVRDGATAYFVIPVDEVRATLSEAGVKKRLAVVLRLDKRDPAPAVPLALAFVPGCVLVEGSHVIGVSASDDFTRPGKVLVAPNWRGPIIWGGSYQGEYGLSYGGRWTGTGDLVLGPEGDLVFGPEGDLVFGAEDLTRIQNEVLHRDWTTTQTDVRGHPVTWPPAETASPEDTPAETMSPPGAVVPPDPPPNTGLFRTYPDVQAPSAVGVGDTFSVTVGFSLTPSPSALVPGPPITALAGPKPEFIVQVSGFGFLFPRGVQQTLIVDRSKPHKDHVIFAVQADPTEGPAPRILEISYEFDGAVAGRTWAEIHVTADTPAQPTPALTGNATLVEGSADETAPHLSIDIFSEPGGAELRWRFHCCYPDIPRPKGEVTTSLTEDSARSFAVQMMRQLPATPTGSTMLKTLAGAGRMIADKFSPSKMAGHRIPTRSDNVSIASRQPQAFPESPSTTCVTPMRPARSKPA